jgi:transcriptional antiterminator RfaH
MPVDYVEPVPNVASPAPGGALAAAAATRAWYVVSTHARREEFAVSQLAQRHVDAWLPRMAFERRGRRVVRPLFPGYVFAHVSLEHESARVIWAPGVRRLVTFEGEAPPVPDAAIAFLQARADAFGLIDVTPRPLPVGRRVRITTGPLAGLVGLIENPPDARGRVSILMDILRQHTRVSVDVAWLEEA